MSSRMGFLLGCLFIVAALFQGATAVTHIVGDSVGWRVPSAGFSYDTWSSAQKFSVGDTLVFNFTTGAHDVAVVSKADYSSCTKTSPIGSIITQGPANVNISAAGDHYYICTIGTHCESNQKLMITVGSSTGSSPTSSPSPSGSTTPTTPSPGTSPSSASSLTVGGFSLLLLSTVMAFFY